MAEVGIQNPTLADVLSRTDPDGKISTILEVAEKSNPIIADAVFVECNDGSKHQTVIRTGIPEPAFRKYNQGVQPSKSTTVPVVDTTGMIEDYSEVDKALADLSGNASSFRASEVVAKVQGFNNFVAHNMFYGDTDVTPEGFLGLDARLNDPTAASGRQLVDGGGTGSDNTSIFFVTWGPRGTQLLYPKGSKAGFQHNDLGTTTKQEGSGTSRELQQIYLDHMKWDIGLTLGDWRSCSRICNIDVSNLTKDASSGADLLDLMIDAEELLDTTSAVGIDMNGNLVEGKTVIYVGRTIAKFLRKQALNKTNVNLTVEQVAGKRVTMWGDYMVRRIDSISDAEAAITF
ncbi:major capsid protein [uncultured Cohaesibacter sp.]|uniref:major capsid protein n=1 Tax=uncultured Cohaesibacter sp. TaxID=1002546 RepID=UPI0029313CC0|nr:hypothetical protein [uncultured Cohaesibacter sp.]